MDAAIVYYPYRIHIYFSPFMMFGGIFMTVILGYHLPVFDFGTILLFAMSLLCFSLAIYLFITSKHHIIFDIDGLKVFDTKHRNGMYFKWEELKYAYYVKDFKNHFILVISYNELKLKNIKRMNYKNLTGKLVVNSCIIVPFVPNSPPKKLTELIEHKVKNVDKNHAKCLF